MASEMIEKIYSAEKQSEELIDKANAEAKEILECAKVDADTLKNNIINAAKSEASDIIKKASDRAKEIVDEVTVSASEYANELRENVKSKAKNGIDEVIGIIIAK